MKPYPQDRDDVAPGHDTSSDSLAEARHHCRNCRYCGGDGFATIYHVKYTGAATDQEFDGRSVMQNRLRRAVAYCFCEIGEKIAANHQRTSPIVFKKTRMLLDVLAARFPEWTAEDPSPKSNSPANHRELREALERMRWNQYDPEA